MKLLVVFALVAVVAVAALPNPFSVGSPELNDQWAAFKLTFSKSYHPTIEPARRLVWEENLRYIQQHNYEHDLGQHTFTMEMNAFGDLTHEEFLATRVGLKKNANRTESANPLFQAPLNMGALPATVDWRTEGYVTPVKDQGQCGSCWAFSTTGSLEGQYFKKNAKLVSFSEQQLVDCSGSYGNDGCNGGLMDNAFKYIKAKGIEKEETYPYTAADGECTYSKSEVVTKVTGFVDIKQGDESDLKNAVGTVGPISVAIDASHNSFQFYSSGVYYERQCSSYQLDHGVLAVGYGTDEASGSDYWLVKNSWAAVWGDKGYIKMARNKKNNCGIATSASYPTL